MFFGSFAWESIIGKDYTGKFSDLDLILCVYTIEDICIAADIFSEWERKFKRKIDCEIKLLNGYSLSIYEFFSTSKQILIKSKKSVKITQKKEIYDLLQFPECKEKSKSEAPPLSLDIKPSTRTRQGFCRLYNYGRQIDRQAALLHKAIQQVHTSIAIEACKALYTELACYPKPGLVSFHDTGSHNNMDHNTFIDSTRTLYKYFNNIIEAIYDDCQFADLVNLGMKAEDEMFKATNGINTHKGAIFSLGLLVAATSKTIKYSLPINYESIRQTLQNTWGKDIEKHAIPLNTHGRNVVNKHHVRGIIKEAVDGYPIIFDTALPTLTSTFEKTKNWNASLIQTLFKILSVLDDTNILYRGGEDALSFAKKEALSFLETGGIFTSRWYNNAEIIHRKFIEKRLSPGGCADMLACTIFLYFSTERLNRRGRSLPHQKMTNCNMKS